MQQRQKGWPYHVRGMNNAQKSRVFPSVVDSDDARESRSSLWSDGEKTRRSSIVSMGLSINLRHTSINTTVNAECSTRENEVEGILASDETRRVLLKFKRSSRGALSNTRPLDLSLPLIKTPFEPDSKDDMAPSGRRRPQTLSSKATHQQLNLCRSGVSGHDQKHAEPELTASNHTPPNNTMDTSRYCCTRDVFVHRRMKKIRTESARRESDVV